MINEKKRLQIKIDKELSEKAEMVLEELGLNPTTAITAFYKRIVANGGIPFPLELTPIEKEHLRFVQLTADTPTISYHTDAELAQWVAEDEEE